MNVAVAPPPATTTETGGSAFWLLEVRLTAIPPLGAALVSVTVPMEETPPITELGLRLRLKGAGGFTVKVPLTDVPLILAVT